MQNGLRDPLKSFHRIWRAFLPRRLASPQMRISPWYQFRNFLVAASTKAPEPNSDTTATIPIPMIKLSNGFISTPSGETLWPGFRPQGGLVSVLGGPQRPVEQCRPTLRCLFPFRCRLPTDRTIPFGPTHQAPGRSRPAGWTASCRPRCRWPRWPRSPG